MARASRAQQGMLGTGSGVSHQGAAGKLTLALPMPCMPWHMLLAILRFARAMQLLKHAQHVAACASLVAILHTSTLLLHLRPVAPTIWVNTHVNQLARNPIQHSTTFPIGYVPCSMFQSHVHATRLHAGLHHPWSIRACACMCARMAPCVLQSTCAAQGGGRGTREEVSVRTVYS